MKENKMEELKERLEELHRIQDARLACGADDLDIREEIAEVEDEIKELEDDINEKNNNVNDANVGSKGNSIEEDIARIAKLITTKFNNDYSIDNKDKEAIEHILSDYKRVLEMNEVLLKENEELKETYKSEKKMKNEYVKLYQDLLLKENVIPIQKIKDKIEELYQQDRNWSEEMSEPDSNFKNIDRNLKRIKNQIDVLQELIEESEENKNE